VINNELFTTFTPPANLSTVVVSRRMRIRTTTTTTTTTEFPALGNKSQEAVQERKSVDPNEVFFSCCKTKKVHPKCESRCNFDTINKKILTQMFIGLDQCPQSFGLDLFSCAASHLDHTSCCQRKNVQRTKAGDKCLAFCDLSPGHAFQADATYIPCWAVLNEVRGCFKEAIVNST